MDFVLTVEGYSALKPPQRSWNVCRETRKFYKPAGILKTAAKLDVVSLASFIIAGVGLSGWR